MNEAQHSAWETIQRGHAIANGVYVVVVNRVGREGKLNFLGPVVCRRSVSAASSRKRRRTKKKCSSSSVIFPRSKRRDKTGRSCATAASTLMKDCVSDLVTVMSYGLLDLVGNIGVVVLMITYLMLQLNKLSSDGLAYSF